MEFTSLLWEDIIFKRIFPFLSIHDLFNFGSISPKCWKLVEAYFVSMTTLDYKQFGDQSFDRYFKTLAQRCSNLREVKLEACPYVTTPLLNKLFSRNHKITTLILNNTVDLESSCLQHVIIECKNLKVLSLRHCSWVTVGCLNALTLHHQSLENVDLSYCYAFNHHHSLNFFVTKLPRLKILRLGGLHCLDSTLSLISNFCQELEVLDLSGGASTPERLKELIESLPMLKFLNLNPHALIGSPVTYSLSDLRKIAWAKNKIVVSTNILSCFMRAMTDPEPS